MVPETTSSETQGQSVGSGEKAQRKFSSKGGRAPGYRLSPDHFQKFKRMPAPDWAQKMLCIIVPNRKAHLLSSFRVFVHNSYCMACLGHAPKKCTSGNFQFDTKFPSDFKMLSAQKLNTLFQKYKLQLTTGIHACIGHVLSEYIYRVFKRYHDGNVAWKSQFIFLFSLYSDYSNLLTLSNASELFWSWISINHIQVHEENEFCHCLFTSFTKREIRHFHG